MGWYLCSGKSGWKRKRPAQSIPKQVSVLLSAQDLEWAQKFKWHLDSEGYARRSNAGGRETLMHRCIVGALPEEVVHHCNRNRLDNRRANLEKMTSEEHRERHRSDEWERVNRRIEQRRQAGRIRP